jgi:hypothetical protein
LEELDLVVTVELLAQLGDVDVDHVALDLLGQAVDVLDQAPALDDPAAVRRQALEDEVLVSTTRPARRTRRATRSISRSATTTTLLAAPIVRRTSARSRATSSWK